MPATPREPLPIVSAAFGLLTAGLLAARAFGVPVEWEVIITAAGIGGLDTARSLLGAGAKALRPVVAPPPVEAPEPAPVRTLTPADARAIAEALAELHAAASRPVAPLAPAPAAVEPAE
jgi:glycosyltransferase involved in cell wall biosynthesis